MKTGSFLILIVLAASVFAPSHVEGATPPYSRLFIFCGPGGVLGGPGETENFLHLGPGLERRLQERVSLSASVGYLAPVSISDETRRLENSVFSFSGFEKNGFWEFSLAPTYYFLKNKNAELFVTLGYSLLIRNGYQNIWHAGLGRDYALSKHLGLRLELRYYPVRIAGDPQHFLELRVGLALN